MTTEGDKAYKKAIQEEVERDPLFLEKCDYHDKIMDNLFWNKGWTFDNCNDEDDNYKPEVQAIFDTIGQLMKEKFNEN